MPPPRVVGGMTFSGVHHHLTSSITWNPQSLPSTPSMLGMLPRALHLPLPSLPFPSLTNPLVPQAVRLGSPGCRGRGKPSMTLTPAESTVTGTFSSVFSVTSRPRRGPAARFSRLLQLLGPPPLRTHYRPCSVSSSGLRG